MTTDGVRDFLSSHAKSKRNGKFSENTTITSQLLNPICGDQVELRFTIEESKITHLGFSAKACAICTASASLLVESANGWSVEDFAKIKIAFEKALVEDVQAEWPNCISEFRYFSHLRVNIRRRACAILPWVAIEKGLKGV